MLGLLITIAKGAITVAPAVEALARRRASSTATEEAWATQAERDAMQHAWSWLQYHSGQRSQAVNFFLLALAILLATYTFALTEDLPEMAAVVAGAGVVIVLFFNQLDSANRSLVLAAEDALAPFQARLAEELAMPEMLLVRAARRRLWRSFAVLILQVLSLTGFVAALTFAIIDSV